MKKISWRSPEYIHTHKTADWYWIVGIVSLSIAIIAIILNNVIFGILVIVSSIMLSLYAAREPDVLDVEINSSGVHVGEKYHSYEEIESFWVETHTHYPRVFLKSKKSLSFFLRILIEDVDPKEIDELLSEHLPKTQHTEPLLEKVLIYLGF